MNDDGMLMAVSPVPSVMMFLSCAVSSLVTHFLHEQDATVPCFSRLRLKLLHTFFCPLASLQVGRHCMKVHEFRRGGA